MFINASNISWLRLASLYLQFNLNDSFVFTGFLGNIYKKL